MFWYGDAPIPARPHRIAVIPGDGVGPEVVASGLSVLQTVQGLDRAVQITWDSYPWGSQYYREHGMMMPEDALETLRTYDAIYFGAVGDPTLPLHLPVWGLILPIRQALDLFVNLRPVLSLDDASSVRMIVVRENTEGEYLGAGSRLYAGTPRELALQISSYSRQGVSRIMQYALSLAQALGMTCTSVTKSNALNYTGVLWDDVFLELIKTYPAVATSSILVDAAAALMITRPERFQVMVTSNLFGDILSDLGAGLVGGLGLAPSANFTPTRSSPGLFEPVHGSAPDIAGMGIANPIGAILSMAMLLGYLGYGAWEDRIFAATKQVVSSPAYRMAHNKQASSTEGISSAIVETMLQM